MNKTSASCAGEAMSGPATESKVVDSTVTDIRDSQQGSGNNTVGGGTVARSRRRVVCAGKRKRRYPRPRHFLNDNFYDRAPMSPPMPSYTGIHEL